MKLDLKYFFCIALLLAISHVQSQVQFSIAVDVKEIGSKDELQVDYVIAGTDKISGFKPPFFDKWKVVSGPDFSSVSFDVNGKKDQLSKYSYVLMPQTTGNIKLPGTSVEANKKKLSCSEVVINVKKQDHVDGVPPPGSSLMFQGGLTMHDDKTEDEFTNEYVLKPGEDPVKKIRNNLFIKAIPSKTKVYVGEPVLVTYKLYTRLKSHSRVVKQPSFEGCSVQEMTSEALPGKEKLDGKTFRSYLFRQVQLIPLQAGKIGVGQASVDNTVTFLSGSSNLRDLYYDIETGDEHNITLSTDPFSIEVVPLPANITTHTIGNFTISARLKKDTSAANEANALIITIEGNGNFKSVAEPEIKWPEGLYHFDATETEELDKQRFPIAGKKIFEIPFEASATGSIDIDPVTISFFDPAKGVGRTVNTNAVHLTVTPAVKANIQRTVVDVEHAGFSISFLYYIIPLAFIIGAVVIWRKPRKKPEAVVVPAVTSEIPAVPTGMQDRYNDLLLVQGDAAFYNKARDLAKEWIQSGNGDQDLLLQVLEDCNTMLYTPLPTTSKKEVLDKLQRAIV